MTDKTTMPADDLSALEAAARAWRDAPPIPPQMGRLSQAYRDAATPDAVLALIAEVRKLRDAHHAK